MSKPSVLPTLTLLERAAVTGDRCAVRAAESDYEGSFPSVEFGWIAEADLLTVPLADPTLPARELLEVLLHIGRGNLAVGRLYEGHVNALQLITRYGTPTQRKRWAADVSAAHHLFGVWNTEAGDGVRIERQGDGRLVLRGSKTFCSGGTHV
ncbi:MAG: acyl-CoA dehydrogenase, partial [Ferruginibacter sp.]|nr:acyl-CoA dehydrogenase [Cytophagales bacterium]